MWLLECRINVDILFVCVKQVAAVGHYLRRYWCLLIIIKPALSITWLRYQVVLFVRTSNIPKTLKPLQKPWRHQGLCIAKLLVPQLMQSIAILVKQILLQMTRNRCRNFASGSDWLGLTRDVARGTIQTSDRRFANILSRISQLKVKPRYDWLSKRGYLAWKCTCGLGGKRRAGVPEYGVPGCGKRGVRFFSPK